MNSKTDFLQPVLPYLQRYFPVTNEQWEMMMNFCEMRHFDKKVILVNEGEVDNYLNMVVKGLVRKFVKRGSNEVTLQLATEGHIIDSEISYIKRVPSPVIVETLEPTTLISLHHDNMLQALEKMPGADRMGRMLLLAMFLKKDERHYKLLKLSTRERFVEFMNDHPHMLQRVPQKYLASYLHIKPETFSRLKHLLRPTKH